jgi:hypothetical protein
MTRLTIRFLVAGVVAALAFAMSTAPSDAAKRKRAAAMAKNCGMMGSLCSDTCSSGFCNVKVCGGDGSWYNAVLTPICPQGACVNVRRKC